jgi:2-C-methyl-D-erythritol 4-phosphate cytidylyltransferase
MHTVAVVLAGGTGQRFGGGLPKQWQPLAGRPLIEHSIAAFDEAPGVDAVLVVLPPGQADRASGLLSSGRYRKLTAVIEGGAARTDSTRRAIEALAARGEQDCRVLFHDAARPLVDQRIIAGCIAALAKGNAVGVTVPSADTIVEVTDGMISATLRRDKLARCQTPQGFLLSVIRRAYQRADADPGFGDRPATDDCGIVLRYLPGEPVLTVPGSERNLKITYPADLAVAEALLRCQHAAT